MLYINEIQTFTDLYLLRISLKNLHTLGIVPSENNCYFCRPF
jgi:hypothetical protein